MAQSDQKVLSYLISYHLMLVKAIGTKVFVLVGNTEDRKKEK